MNPLSLNDGTAKALVRAGLFVLVLGLVAATWIACNDSNASPRGEKGVATAPPETRLRVRVDSVRLDALPIEDRITATVRAYHRATITAETQGRVLERVVEPGTDVEVDGGILRLEDSRMELELRRAEASLSAARTVLAHAKREFARGERLLAQKALSTQQYDDLQHGVDRARDEVALAAVARDTAKRNLADTRIDAPFAGSVDSIAVDVGDYVTPGTPVAVLVDLSRVRILGSVTAGEAARLVPGTIARVTFRDLGGDVFEARLESVARVASAKDGTYVIELRMDDPERKLRDGLVAMVELPDPDQSPRLIAKRAALLRRNGHPEVFVIDGGGDKAVARTRRVRTGRSAGEWIEILEGLSEGDRVVWDGHFALGDGVAVVVDGEG
jgi:membrane fusion protein (multidrug efflux system)